MLHSKDYREKYKEFLNWFPKGAISEGRSAIPLFWEYRQRTSASAFIVKLLFMKIETTYPVSGTNIVETLRYEDGKVFINET